MCTWFRYFHVSAWHYYLAMTVPLVVTLVVSWPQSPAVTTVSVEQQATAVTLSLGDDPRSPVNQPNHLSSVNRLAI